MPDVSISGSEPRRSGGRIVAIGIAAIVAILVVAGAVLLLTLPDANAFNARVERLFVESDLTTGTEIKLLEILAQSGTAFADTLASYRMVIFVLLVFATAMMVAALVFLVLLAGLNRRMAQIERAGIQVNSLLISREENTVYLNNMDFKLTAAAMETLSVLAEARLDDEVLSGVEIEAMISGRDASDCEEAAGATRIKRLRDTLGNQMVSELLVKNIARRGYMLAIEKDVIRMVVRGGLRPGDTVQSGPQTPQGKRAGPSGPALRLPRLEVVERDLQVGPPVILRLRLPAAADVDLQRRQHQLGQRQGGVAGYRARRGIRPPTARP